MDSWEGKRENIPVIGPIMCTLLTGFWTKIQAVFFFKGEFRFEHSVIS